MVPGAARPRNAGLGDDTNLEDLSEGGRTAEHFDGIDWSAAAPSWISMIAGLFMPSLALAALVILIDVVLCRLIQRWTDHLWGGAPWLLSIMIFPAALMCAVCCGKLVMNLARRKR
jgi:hypothetical protein